MTDPRFIRLDMFPAIVLIEGEPVLSNVRAIVTDTELVVFQDSYGGPAEVYRGALADFTGSAKTGYSAEIDDGPTATITRSSGCGCGSLLRGFRPYPSVPFSPHG